MLDVVVEKFLMNDHGVYVWTVYGMFAVVVALVLKLNSSKHRKLLKKVRQFHDV